MDETKGRIGNSGSGGAGGGVEALRSPLRKRRRVVRLPTARNEDSDSLVQDLREEIEELKKEQTVKNEQLDEKDVLLGGKDVKIDKLEGDLATCVGLLRLEEDNNKILQKTIEDMTVQFDQIRADRDKLARICDITSEDLKKVRADNEELRVRVAAAEVRARAKFESVSVSRNASAEDENYNSQTTPGTTPQKAPRTSPAHSAVTTRTSTLATAIAEASADDNANPRKLDFTGDTKSMQDTIPQKLAAPKPDTNIDTGFVGNTGMVEALDNTGSIVATAAAKLISKTVSSLVPTPGLDKSIPGAISEKLHVPLRLRLKQNPGETVQDATTAACNSRGEILLRLPLKVANGRVGKRQGKR